MGMWSSFILHLLTERDVGVGTGRVSGAVGLRLRETWG